MVVKFTYDQGQDEFQKFDGYEELYNKDFYLQERANVCAVCGSTKEFSKFQTIPSLYRLQFSHAIKCHCNNDIVLLC